MATEDLETIRKKNERDLAIAFFILILGFLITAILKSNTDEYVNQIRQSLTLIKP